MTQWLRRVPSRRKALIALALGGVVMIAVGALLYRRVGVKAALTGISSIVEPDNAWARCGPTIAHALGAIDSEIYTNSREAFIHSYRRGYRNFEVDVALSSDGEVILEHDWATPEQYESPARPSYEQFMKRRVRGRYTPIDLNGMIALASEYQDARLILDFKPELAVILPQIVNRFRESAPTAIERLIPQIYHQSDLETALRIYPFRSIIYTLYRTEDSNEEAIRFAREHGIGVIVLSEPRFDPWLVRRLARDEVAVYVQTVNSAPQVQLYRKWGAAGVMSDILNPDSLCPNAT